MPLNNKIAGKVGEGWKILLRQQQQRQSAEATLLSKTSRTPEKLLFEDPIKLQNLIGWPLHPKTLRPSRLYDYQTAILTCPARFVLVNKSRKIGLTETMLRRCMWKCLTEYAAYQVLLLSQKDEFSTILMARFQELFDRSPLAWMVEKELHDYIRLSNGCEVYARPSTNASMRGFEKVKGVYMDEAAHFILKNDEKIYAAIRPNIINTGGDMMIISTPNGQRGIFYRLFQNDDSFQKWTLPYHVAPDLIDPVEIEKERAALGPVLFDQEYLCSFSPNLNAAIPEEYINRNVNWDEGSETL